MEGGKCWSRKTQKEILKHLNELLAIYSLTLATIICHRNLFVQGVIIGLTLPSYDFFRLVTKRFIYLNRYFFDYKSELFPDANAPQMPASFSVLLYYANPIFWANFKKLFSAQLVLHFSSSYLLVRLASHMYIQHSDFYIIKIS